MAKEHTFKRGDYVFAKVRGYPAWPARIEEILDPRPATLKYNVFFFGTSETAAVQAKEVYPYLSNKEKYGKPIKRKFFNEGIQELEDELKKVSGGEAIPSQEPKNSKKSNLMSDLPPTADSLKNIEVPKADEEAVAPKRKRKISQVGEGTKSIEGEGELSAKRKRKGSAVIEKPKDKTEESETRGKRKGSSVDSRDIAVTGGSENSLSDNTKDSALDKRKISSNKILKSKSDGGVDNINAKESDNQDGGRKRKRSSQESDASSLKEQISRSGRRIKPKKFLYDDENKEDVDGKEKSAKGKLSSPDESKDETSSDDKNASPKAGATPKKSRMSKESPNAEEKDYSPTLSSLGRVIWAKAKTGDVVQIKIDHNRPDSIKSNKSRVQYETEYEERLKLLKEKVEHGELMTTEVLVQLKPSPESLASMTEEEIEQRKNLRTSERKIGRTRWLKLESRLVNIDVLLRSALQKEKVNIDKALELLDEYIYLPMDPLMLKKNPQLVETVKKLIYYTGNVQCWKLSTDEEAAFNKKAAKVRQKANTLTNKFRGLFAVTKPSEFWIVFKESLNEFQDATKHLSLDSLYELTIDPTSPYFKEVAEYDREDKEFDAKLKQRLEAIESDENKK